MLSKSQFIQRARMMDEACRQWCDLIEECRERADGQGFTEFYHEICDQKYEEYTENPSIYGFDMPKRSLPLTRGGSLHSFELDRWSEPDENHRVKHIGKYIGDLVNEYADAKCQLSMPYDADPAHVEEQRQKGIAEADKLIANKVLEAIRTMLRKDRETGAFEYAEARKAYYTERLICEILMALEQNAVNMGMEYDDCQKAMGGDLSKAAKKEWYLRHKDRGMEP